MIRVFQSTFTYIRHMTIGTGKVAFSNRLLVIGNMTSQRYFVGVATGAELVGWLPGRANGSADGFERLSVRELNG